MTNPMTLPRRHMLAGSAAALSALGLAGWTGVARAQAAATPKPLPGYAGWKSSKLACQHRRIASTATSETSVIAGALNTPAATNRT